MKTKYKFIFCQNCRTIINQEHPRHCTKCGTEVLVAYQDIVCDCGTTAQISGLDKAYCPDCSKPHVLGVVA